MKRERFYLVLVFIAYFALTYFYLHPGSKYLFESNTQYVLSDDTDPAGVPYAYGINFEYLKKSPSLLLYGGVVDERINAPEGHIWWQAWSEKIVAALTPLLFNLEQISTAMSFVFLFLSAMAMYAFGRCLGWGRAFSFAGGVAYGFTAYLRARAKVHAGLTGIFHLPLIFLGLHLIKTRKDRKSFWIASLAFLVSGTIPPYYQIMTAFLIPFLLWYLLSDTGFSLEGRQRLKRAIFAAIPVLLLGAWTVLKPLPRDSKVIQVYPQTGESREFPHPFMDRFGASPIDYLAGDLGGTYELGDWNFLREWVTEYIAGNLGQSNHHERTNGIRWSVLFLFFCGLWALKKKPDWLTPVELFQIRFFSILALVGFLISLTSVWFGIPIGPSGWIHALVSQYRVPNRAGIVVSFSTVVAGLVFLGAWLRSHDTRIAILLKWPGALAFVFLVDLPPIINPTPIARVLPVYSSLQPSAGGCGYGLYFPYVSANWGAGEFYHFMQRMRGSSCKIVNSTILTQRDQIMMNSFPLHPELLNQIASGQPALKENAVRLTQCLGLDWLVFDTRVPQGWREEVCKKLGWQMTEADVCKSGNVSTGLRALPEQCIRSGP